MAPPMGDVSGPTAMLMPDVSSSGSLFVHPSDFQASVAVDALRHAIYTSQLEHAILDKTSRDKTTSDVSIEPASYEEGYVYDPTAPIPAGSTDVVLVRHGETFWNHDHRLQGQLDTELNAAGLAQAQAVAARFATWEFPFCAIYASDLRRAADTAQAIADRAGFPGIVRDVGLRERHIGHLQGCLAHEAPLKQPEAFKAFHSEDPSTAIPGGGESMAQLVERTSKTVDKIARNHRGKRVVVVCHGAVMMALHRHALGHDSSMGVINASINVVRVSADHTWRVLHWGDVKHLDGMEFDHDGFGGGKDSA
ncbi:hypothetical protein CLOM_g24444 [Closterium sp. NIES-68]|nr:hypothetical protein CLOM_g24444 [Closterium sp. NIES-68]GJP58107.1 hypothetical protein CLOP_g20467 [Closterium sp. NIES-67]GJP67861.1 hypothetical protein CLOP_g24625 [Closterium sp. NIES-67]